MNNISLRPLRGSLYKRKAGRYIAASSPERAVFYYEFSPYVDASLKVRRVCLRTTDPFEARMRADAIAWKAFQLAEELYMRAVLSPESIGGNATDSPRAVSKEAMVKSRIALADLWGVFCHRYEARTKSMSSYNQMYNRFLNWACKANVVYASDVTRGVAEAYQRDLFARKCTAKRDMQLLVRIWRTVFPDVPSNPWNTGLHLQARKLEKRCNYRVVKAPEARKVRAELMRSAQKDGKYAAVASDLADGLVMSWWYGLRIGSLASIRWRDIRHDHILHVPPKTAGSKPFPLELPLVPEVSAMLSRRQRDACSQHDWVFPELERSYEKSASHLANFLKDVFRSAKVCDEPSRGRASWHSFRASFITQMDEANVASGITDAITGHAPKCMHDHYSHASLVAKKKSLLSAIEPLDGRSAR